MCLDKLSSVCNFNKSGNCCKGLLEKTHICENKKAMGQHPIGCACSECNHISDVLGKPIKEISAILSLLHIEMCGVCGRKTLHVDVLGAQKRCMNCLGVFRNRRAE